MGAAYDYEDSVDLLKPGLLPWMKKFRPKVGRPSASPMTTDIFLVEDDFVTLNFIKAAITKVFKLPVRIHSFISGESALKHLSLLEGRGEPGPDIAIIDYLLPGEVDGLSICSRLESRFSNTQTMLISSLPPEFLAARMKNLRVAPQILPKPFEASYLMNLITQ